jgi:hypothetical protein
VQPPFTAREFSLYYDFDMTVTGRHAGLLSQIVDYAERSDARRVIVTSLRGATLLSDGSRMSEQPDIAKARANEVIQLLRRAGLSKPAIQAAPRSEPEPADGVDDWQSRRTTVRVEP